MCDINNHKINQAVIIAGGRGERLKPFTDEMPKPMYIVEGKPFIEHLIKNFGIENILLLLGYKAEKIVDYLGDGKNFGVHIDYDITDASFDTAERMTHAIDKYEDIFLFMYCDNICPINYKKLVDDFYKHNADIQISVYKNKDKWTKDNLIVDENGLVVIYDKTKTNPNLQGVDIGYEIIKKSAINRFKDLTGGFNKIVFPKLVEEKKIFATTTEHRYYSIGSFDRMKYTEEFLKNKKVCFLDRDGTLNVRPDKACYIEKEEDFIWLDGAKEAVKLLNDNNYLVILITNQPGIKRGNLTIETLAKIHNKMQKDLTEIGAKIDKIYYCPHNWDENCECRKPKPGMIFDAQKDFSINLNNAILFGDDERDIEAANNANVKSVLITYEYNLYKAVNDLINNKL